MLFEKGSELVAVRERGAGHPARGRHARRRSSSSGSPTSWTCPSSSERLVAEPARARAPAASAPPAAHAVGPDRDGRRPLVVVRGCSALAWSRSPGWPTVQGDVLQLGATPRTSFPDIRDGVLAQRQAVPDRRALDPRARRSLVALARQAPVAVAAAAAGPRRRLHRPVPRHPDVLLVLLLGFGMPALRLQGLPNSSLFWATVALVLSYGAYVAEVFRAGIESVHPSQVASAEALGLTRGQTHAPRGRPAGGAPRRTAAAQRLRLAAEGHRAGRRSVGVFEAVFAARGLRRTTTSTTRRCVVVALLLHRADGPAGAAHRLARPRGCVERERAGAPMTRAAGGRGPAEVVRRPRRARRRRPHRRAARRGLPDRLVGSGKSTLLRCLNLLEDIDDGVIPFEGREISDPRVDAREVRRGSGMVFQAYNLFPHLTVLDNCTLAPRRVHGARGPTPRPGRATLLDRFGLADQAGKHPDRLSGGQQQRAALVRALCTEPTLLLLDEITAALDPELVGEVLEIVRAEAEAGMTMVIATHEMAFARDVATSLLPRRGPDPRAGPARADLQRPPRGADPAVPAPGAAELTCARAVRSAPCRAADTGGLLTAAGGAAQAAVGQSTVLLVEHRWLSSPLARRAGRWRGPTATETGRTARRQLCAERRRRAGRSRRRRGSGRPRRRSHRVVELLLRHLDVADVGSAQQARTDRGRRRTGRRSSWCCAPSYSTTRPPLGGRRGRRSPRRSRRMSTATLTSAPAARRRSRTARVSLSLSDRDRASRWSRIQTRLVRAVAPQGRQGEVADVLDRMCPRWSSQSPTLIASMTRAERSRR